MNSFKFHYRLHKRPPLVAILTQLNPVYSYASSNFLNIHFNIILPSTPSFSK
jgi:hypothetical protein